MIEPRSWPRSGRIESVSDIAAADERAILDQLRKAQDAHHGGDQDAAKTLLDELFSRYGARLSKRFAGGRPVTSWTPT